MTKNIDIIRSLEIEPLARFLAEVAEDGVSTKNKYAR